MCGGLAHRTRCSGRAIVHSAPNGCGMHHTVNVWDQENSVAASGDDACIGRINNKILEWSELRFQTSSSFCNPQDLSNLSMNSECETPHELRVFAYQASV